MITVKEGGMKDGMKDGMSEWLMGRYVCESETGMGMQPPWLRRSLMGDGIA